MGERPLLVKFNGMKATNLTVHVGLTIPETINQHIYLLLQKRHFLVSRIQPKGTEMSRTGETG
jgi:hypothetical protein